MSTVATQGLTADDFWEFASRAENQGKRLELERGEVVEMSSPGERHGALCVWIGYLLLSYVIRRGSGVVCSNDTGLLVEQGPDTVRGPDVMLFGESRSLDQLSPKYSTRIPLLIVEVLSPTDQMTKVNLRIKQYLARGVSLVWLVDAEVRSVTIYRAGQEFRVVDETEELTGEDVLPDLRLRVAEMFKLPG